MNICLIHIFSLESDLFFFFFVGCLEPKSSTKKKKKPSRNEKKKKAGFFLGRKTEFYQRLMVENNTICLGYVFCAVRFVLTFSAYLIMFYLI